jgi:hypothetical protein
MRGRAATIRHLFTRRARSLDDLIIKACFWRSFSRAIGGDDLELQYLAEDAVHWFNDALLSDIDHMAAVYPGD